MENSFGTTSVMSMYCGNLGPRLARFLTGAASFPGLFEAKFAALETV